MTYAITITRQFGSLGRPIAKRMAEILGIKYYDRDIVDQTAQKNEVIRKRIRDPKFKIMFSVLKVRLFVI